MFCQLGAVSGRRVIATSDNVQYHRSKLHLAWRDQQAPQISLDFLPPYSLELNPIEPGWKLTRRQCLQNRYVGFLDEVVFAVENQIRRLDKTLRYPAALCAST
jgi:transposase